MGCTISDNLKMSMHLIYESICFWVNRFAIDVYWRRLLNFFFELRAAQASHSDIFGFPGFVRKLLDDPEKRP